MKTKTMKDIKSTMAALLEYVEAVGKFTNAITCSLVISDSVGDCPKAVFRLHVRGTTYLKMLDDGIVVDAGSVLPAGTYRIGPNTIKESFGTLHADGCLYFVGDDCAECYPQIEITACASKASSLSSESQAYRPFLKMYADAEQDRLEKMLQ